MSKHCFGGGVYSTTHSRMLRMVGRGQRHMAEISIKQRSKGTRLPNGVFRPQVQPNFMPQKLIEQFHRGGNSLCYQIQLAHLMGFERIYAMGYTLQSGLSYYFGRENPVTRRTTLYDSEVPLLWLSWYESQFPGRVKLLPGFAGPVYDVFDTEGFDDIEERFRLRRDGPAEAVATAPKPDSGKGVWADAGVQRLRPQRSDRPIHADGQQPEGDQGPSVCGKGETPGWW